MLPQFRDPRLKTARARRHIAELGASIDEFLSREPFVMRVENAPSELGSNVWAWTIRVHQPVPPDLSPIIGDITHNLRSALDLLANDLVRANGGSTKGVYFPVAESETALPDQIRNKNFHRAGTKAVDALKLLQPYKGGHSGLRIIHDLDIRDKHQALTPVAHGYSLDLSGLVPPDATPHAISALKNWSSRIEGDTSVAVVIPAGWGLKVGTKIKAKYALTLDTGDDCAGQDVVTVLRELARVTEETIDFFAAALA